MNGAEDIVAEQLTGLGSIAASVQDHLAAAWSDLSAIAAAACSLLDEAESQGRRPGRGDLAAIRASLQECLRRPEPAVDGVGIATAAGYLEDSAYWLEWWRRGRGDNLEFVAHSLNPHRDAFYDYSSRPWFTAPAASRKTTVTGPYVDVGGTNTSTVTLSLPLFTREGFAGVAGADIAAARFEQFLVGPGHRLRPVVLTNAALRVISSNSADYLPGDLLSSSKAGNWVQVPVKADATGQDPWRLIHL